MTTITRQRATRTDGMSEAERHLYSIVLLAGTIILAGVGMAFAILLAAHAVRLSVAVVL
jgi:hypothetical protein